MTKTDSATVYLERLTPGPSLFVATGLIAPSVALVFLPINALLGLVAGVVATITVWVLLVASAPRVSVDNDMLRVGLAKLPLNSISGLEEVAKTSLFYERGPGLDTRAFIKFAPTVKTALKISVSDPMDPTPYWLISTRSPKALIAALGRSRSI